MTKRTLLLAALLASSGLACVKESGTVFLYGVCSPPTDAKTCTMGSTCTGYSTLNLWFATQVQNPLPPAGVVDNDLVAFMEFHNELPDNSTDTRTNTNHAIIQGYKLSYSASGLAIPSYTVDKNSAYQGALGTTVPPVGTATSVVPLIPTPITSYIRGLVAANSTTYVTVTVKAFGVYGDQSAFETPPYQVSVALWNGNGTLACVDATKTRTGVCPNDGQTASVSCE
jgi:hypothetical protein